jgi:ParB family chromosome partitioning protein
MARDQQDLFNEEFAQRDSATPQSDNAAGSSPQVDMVSVMPSADSQSASIDKEEAFKSGEAQFDAGLKTCKINPALIFPSKWANRHASSFQGAEFEALKADIRANGGNVQPIKIRPCKDNPDRFEIVFGHLRHRACSELCLDVLALLEDVDDKKLFIEMDRENRNRSDLRPYEIGLMYARALDEELFPSIRMLAEAVGIDQSQLSKATRLSRLPTEVINAFPSPLDLQYRWAEKLTSALQKDHDLVIDRARQIQEQVPRPSGTETYTFLVEGRGTVPHKAPEPIVVAGNRDETAQIYFDEPKRSAAVKFLNLDSSRFDELQKSITAFLR